MVNDKKKIGKDAIVLGIVESIDDPTFSGRVKVRVPGVTDNIPTELLPWCSYGGSAISSANGGGSISILRVGQQVRIKFKSDDITSMEWTGVSQLDPALIDEIKGDYENAHVLIYDSAIDLSIKYQNTTGLIIYYQGSFIQMMPDGTITLHYGKGATGTLIQLSDGRVDIQAGSEINLSTSGTINLEADNIVLNAKTAIQMAGSASGEAAINGAKLMTALMMLANAIDNKVPQTAGITSQYINGMKEGIINLSIQYFKHN